MEKKSNHQVNIVKLGEPRIHTNADSLELFDIGGYQVVTKKGQFKAGDLAVYIQPDSVIPKTEPFKFIWGQYECEPNGEVPEKRRRITVRKFRGEWSEGLLMPVDDFGKQLYKQVPSYTGGSMEAANGPYYMLELNVKEGDDVSDILGITHYEPLPEKSPIKGQNEHKPKKRPKTFWGWFWYIIRWLKGERDGSGIHVPVYDVEAFKNHKNAFNEGELVYVTEKIHGSNARYVYIDGHMYAGSRTLWKSPKSNCVWRQALKQNPWIEEWCKAHEGYALYGEVVPTQGKFKYGCKEGEVKFFAFDILTPLGKWEKPWKLLTQVHDEYVFETTIPCVPIYYIGPFNLEVIKNFVDGASHVGNHIREGIVVTPVEERHVHGLGRLQLKLVSNIFLNEDSK